MRKQTALIVAPLAALAMLPAAAQAQDLTRAAQQLVMSGNAPVACVINAPRAASQTNATFAETGTASGRINITQFVDPESAEPRASSIELNVPVLCNTAHRMRVSSTNGGLLRGGAAGAGTSGGFSEFVGYTIGIDWQGQTTQFTTTSNNAIIDSDRPGRGDATIRIATPAGGTPLIAGQYRDVIVVEVEPSN